MTAHRSSAFVTWGIRVAGALASAVGAFFFLVWLAGSGNEFSAQGIIIPKTNAALALLLSGAALLLLAPEHAGGLRRHAGAVLAAAAGLLGALTLGQHLFGLDFGIDQLLATEVPGVARTASPNRMGPPASVSVTLVGLGLLALALRRRVVAPYAGLVVCVINLLPAVGFLYGVHGFYDQPLLTGIAWPTVVALLALGIGLALSEDKRGPLALLLRDDAGGALFRRMLPAVLLIPLSLGFLGVLGQYRGWYDTPTGTGLLVMTLVLIFSAVLWRNAARLSSSAAAEAEADRALGESRERLALATSSTGIGLFDWNITEGSILWTHQHDVIFGYAPRTTTTTTATTHYGYRHWADRVHPEDLPTVEEEARRCTDERTPLDIEYRIVWPDGSLHWVHTKGVSSFDDQGRPVQVLGTVMDITERKRAEEVSRQRLVEIDDLYRNAPVGLCVLDRDLRFQRINERLAEINGIPAADHIGKTVRELMPALADAVEPGMRRVLETGEPKLDIEIASETPAQPGVMRSWTEHWLPIKDSQGQVTGLSILVEETTARRRAEAALRESAARLRQLYDAMNDGLAVHELVYDAQGQATDYRVLDVNPAYERITGISRERALGALASVLYGTGAAPFLDQYLPVAVSGQPAAFERDFAPMGKSFYVSVFSPSPGRFATVFADITARKQTERNLTFLSELGEAFAPRASVEEIGRIAAEKVGRYFGAGRVNLSEVSLGEEAVVRVFASQRDEGLKDDRTTHRLGDFLPPELIAELRAGRQVVVEDVGTDPRLGRFAAAYAPWGHRSFVAMPFVSGGQWKFHMAVHKSDPHAWRADELALLQEVAARVRIRLERAQAEAALRESTERLQMAKEAAALGIHDCDVASGVIQWDARVRQLWGIGPDEPVTFETFVAGVHPDDRAATQAAVDRALDPQGDGRYYAEHRVRHRLDGSERHVAAAGQVTFVDGRAVRLVGTVQDITARKQAGEALRVSAERFRLATAATHAMVYDLDVASSRVAALDGVRELLGYEPSETELTLDWWDRRVHPDDLAMCHAAFQRMQADGHGHTLHYRLQHKDGRSIDVEDSATVGRDAAGNVVRIVGTVVDITPRKQAEAALRESEERYRAFVAVSNPVLYRVDADWTELLEMTDDGFLAGPTRRRDWFSDYFHPDDMAVVQAAIRQAVHSKGLFEVTHRIRRADGSLGWTQSRAVPLLDAAGNIREWFGAATDVTAPKQAEERERKEHRETELANRVLKAFAEREGEELFAEALAAVQEGLASRHGVFGYIPEPGHLVCPSLSKMLDECEIEGKCIHYPPGKWKGLWARALRERRSFSTNVAPPVPAGHPVIHNNLATPILFRGEAIGLLNLANKEGGYTEEDRQALDGLAARVAPVLYAWIQRKLREDDRAAAVVELRKTAENLARSNADLEQFAYVASHDLQEPLRAVSGFMSLLLQRYGNTLEGKASQYMTFAAEGANRMSHLIHDLLAFSRVQSGEMDRKPVEMNAAFDRAVADCAAGIQESGARVTRDDLPTVSGDAIQLGQLLQNLIGNAVKFRRPGVTPEVHVAVRRTHGAWEFSVNDNGIGMPAGSAEKIFAIFQRLHTRQKYPGTGMGLAICKRIVERHGGSIRVESTPGSGSRFIFTVPA